MTSLPTTPLPADSLEQLDWMSGAWIEDTPLRRCEEIWSTVDAHTLMGMFRWISDDDVSFYEFMVIKMTETGAELHVKHFHPTLVAWEEKECSPVSLLTPAASAIIIKAITIAKANKGDSQPSFMPMVVATHIERAE